MNKNPYAGKTSNKSAMDVKAPYAQKTGKSPTVKKGSDLRSGGKK